nr:ribosomal RNA small subunit methyltransferase [Tanacetum cinerariifolium]
MSFLVGRLAAGKEGAYFLQESKHAVGRMADKINKNHPVAAPTTENKNQSDVLPEILKHNLPANIFRPASDATLSSGSKWVVVQSDGSQGFISSVSRDAINPLRGYVSLPQVTFGPKRWQLPNTDNSYSASTANELRTDKYTPINAEKLKAAAVGLSQIAKAFATATALVFGGATLTIGLAVSQLELHSTDDIRTKGKDIVKPKFESIKEQVAPLRNWAEDVAKKWHIKKEENIKEKPLIKELSRMLGPRRSST